MKKILILLPIVFILLLGCNEETSIYEPEVKLDSLNLPFESRENGKVLFIYRNNSTESIPITLAMVKPGEVLKNSQNIDFCPDIINARKGAIKPDWFIVNFNIPIVPESSVLNQNDHPNLVSYSFPKATYVGFLMTAEGCNKDQYDVFDITTDEGITIINSANP